MTFIPYEPPRPQFADTMLAYHAITRPHFGVLIEPDPLGPVNKIVTLMRDNHRVRSVLRPVPAGADVRVGHDSTPSIGFWTSTFEPIPELSTPGRDEWFIEVDGRRVLTVPAADTVPPPRPVPRVPWRRRLRHATWGALAEQLRADSDRVAGWLGYHRDEECER